MSRKTTKTKKTEKSKGKAEPKVSALTKEKSQVQIEFEIKQDGDKLVLIGNGQHFAEGATTDELKLKAEKIAALTNSTFSVKVQELPKPDEKTAKVYDMIGINGKHEQLNTFKALCKKNGWKIGEVLLKMITSFNEQNKQ